jgi:hypothetical protein
MNEHLRKSLPLPLCLIFLAGLIFGSPGYVLCMGEDGRMEFETICLPSGGGGGEAVCEIGPSPDCHHDHDACSDCSDLELDGPFRSQRSGVTAAPVMVPAICGTGFSVLAASFETAPAASHLVHNQGPPAWLATTVLRC